MKTPKLVVCLLAGLMGFTFSAFAADKSASATTNTPTLYYAANCFNCHGTDGKSGGTIPGLAGRDRELTISQLRGFKSGERAATIMHQLAKGYTDEEIVALADFFARQKP